MDDLFLMLSFHAKVSEFATYTAIRIRKSLIREDRIAVTTYEV